MGAHHRQVNPLLFNEVEYPRGWSDFPDDFSRDFLRGFHRLVNFTQALFDILLEVSLIQLLIPRCVRVIAIGGGHMEYIDVRFVLLGDLQSMRQGLVGGSRKISREEDFFDFHFMNLSVQFAMPSRNGRKDTSSTNDTSACLDFYASLGPIGSSPLIIGDSMPYNETTRIENP